MKYSVLITLAFAALNCAAGKLVKDDGYVRRAVCIPASAGNVAIDDTPAIQSAISTCGNGGTIKISAGQTFSIRSVLSFAGCVGCDFQLEGTLKVSDDLDYWEGRTAIILMSGIKGAKVRSLTGSGIIDGNGQAAYERFAANSSYRRPTLWYTTGSSNILFDNIAMKNPPNVFHSAAGSSSNIVYSNVHMSAVSTTTTAPKNTDGYDIGPASYVTITNAMVYNQDDCVAFKSGANYVTVTNILCSGSHGLSVGSLGSHAGSTDTVSNIYVYNATMIDSAKAVGIKLYPGGSSYGTAVVNNVTYDTVAVNGCDYAAQIQSCYGGTASVCSATPSTAKLTDIWFKNFRGTTSTHYAPVVSNLDCPAAGTCDVHFSNYVITAGKGTAENLCANLPANSGITCVAGASG